MWLEVHGFKPVETEVDMPYCHETKKGWIADIAAVIHPTQTECIEMKIIRPRPRGSYPYTSEYWEKDAAWQIERDALTRFMTCLVEVKTSRADFRGDRKWTAPCPADLSYLAIVRGICKPEEWPVGWGILEFHEGKIKQLRPPTPRTVDKKNHFAIVYSIALKRDHHTRHARWREYQREERISNGHEKTLWRINDLARMMVSITKGNHDSVENNLKWHGIKNVTPWLISILEPLWNIQNGAKPDESEV